MKYLITIVIAALSLNGFSQGIPQLPYNPDENGDGVIGVPDLQTFLAYYGTEFSAAILAEDLNTAVLYVGNMGYLKCRSTCASLSGPWSMIDLNSAGLILDEFTGLTWISTENQDFSGGYALAITNSLGYIANYAISTSKICYCDTHQSPKVEFNQILEGDWGEMNEQLSNEGWRLHSANSNKVYFWRWAE